MAGCLKEKESARRSRWTQTLENVNQGARPLEPLRVGDRVFVQNQVGSHARKWDRPGVGVEVRANDQYVVKLDGSGRTSLRNRRFLRRYTMPQSSLVGGGHDPPVVNLKATVYRSCLPGRDPAQKPLKI